MYIMALELRQQQKQNLSQRMIQSVQILQMSSQELESYVDELALENPAMDVKKSQGESIDSWHQNYAEAEHDHYLAQRQRNDDDYDPRDTWNFNTQHGETLKEYLWSQINPRLFSKSEILILDYMMDCLDDRGYLTESAGETADRFEADEDQVSDLIHFLQTLEPAGICAHNISECLQLQLDRKGLLNDALKELTDHHLDLVAKSKTSSIASKLGISKSQASKYCDLIKTLDPRPGGRFYRQEEIQYIIPDVYVTKKDDDFEISLNAKDTPVVSVNDYYQRLLKSTKDGDVKEYLDTKIKQTAWVRQCIEQRRTTMIKVTREIINFQRAFFERGPDYMKPLKIAEIADAIEMHESTVSRAIDKKYLQCSFGVFPMSYFFQRKATARDTRSCAIDEQSFTSDQIKKALREIIAAEDPKKPYSDRILSEKLAERGISISRRTVAKYRVEAGIPDASGRK